MLSFSLQLINNIIFYIILISRMSDQPLFYSQNFKKIVNPVKILPSLLQKQEERKKINQTRYTKIQSNILSIESAGKQKKIKKQDIRKHYRTKMCPYGRECKKRFTCTFAHTQQQLRKPFMKRKNPCILYQRGQCSLGSACRDYHGNIDLQKNYKYKQKICENYLLGKCQKGNVCIFLHEDPKEQQMGEEINEQLSSKYPQEINQENQKQEAINEDKNEQKNEQKIEINNEQNKKKDNQQDNEEFLDLDNANIVLSFQ